MQKVMANSYSLINFKETHVKLYILGVIPKYQTTWLKHFCLKVKKRTNITC